MELTSKQLAELIRGMRAAYARGENAMCYARGALEASGGESRNQRFATLVAYDLQAGTYVANVRKDPAARQRWCQQLAHLISPLLPKCGRLLEVGVGEATTLAGVLAELTDREADAFGFDISWSRVAVGNEWLRERSQAAKLFVGDLLNIPLADNSMDVVYSSHSLEPNAGHETVVIAECLRVARHAVVLVEPIYELASPEAQARMRHHGYVRGLRESAERLGADVMEYRLLDHIANPLNPSGVLSLRKRLVASDLREEKCTDIWRCPLTGEALQQAADGFFAPTVGIVYPILKDIPLLRQDHAVVASGFGALGA